MRPNVKAALVITAACIALVSCSEDTRKRLVRPPIVGAEIVKVVSGGCRTVKEVDLEGAAVGYLVFGPFGALLGADGKLLRCQWTLQFDDVRQVTTDSESWRIRRTDDGFVCWHRGRAIDRKNCEVEQ